LAFGSIALAGFAPRSPLAAELTRQLRAQVQVLPAPDRADVVLEALDDTREKSIVASTAAAQVREVQLRLRFHFSARTPSGRLLIPRAELMVARDLSTTEAASLAKAFEEAELYREMQTDVVQQVLRRLASITL
jgi:LPS-assembly lipoprotein